MDIAQAFIENNTFYGCYARSTGATVSAYTAQILFQGNLISGTRGGQAMATWSTNVFTNGCNLYWANEGGDFGDGWTASPTDVFQDPLFCDAAGLDFSVRSDSPCVTFPGGCPQIGALGTGCGPVAVESSTFGRVKAMFR